MMMMMMMWWTVDRPCQRSRCQSHQVLDWRQRLVLPHLQTHQECRPTSHWLTTNVTYSHVNMCTKMADSQQTSSITNQTCGINDIGCCTIQCRSMVSHRNKLITPGSFSPRLSEKNIEHHLEEQSKNKHVLKRTGQDMLETTVWKRERCWFGHVQRMEDSRRVKRAVHWFRVKEESEIHRSLPGQIRSGEISKRWTL